MTALTPEARIALMMLLLFAFMMAYELRTRPRVSCPSCGARNGREHNEACQWAKYHGEEL